MPSMCALHCPATLIPTTTSRPAFASASRKLRVNSAKGGAQRLTRPESSSARAATATSCGHRAAKPTTSSTTSNEIGVPARSSERSMDPSRRKVDPLRRPSAPRPEIRSTVGQLQRRALGGESVDQFIQCLTIGGEDVDEGAEAVTELAQYSNPEPIARMQRGEGHQTAGTMDRTDRQTPAPDGVEPVQGIRRSGGEAATYPCGELIPVTDDRTDRVRVVDGERHRDTPA